MIGRALPDTNGDKRFSFFIVPDEANANTTKLGFIILTCITEVSIAVKAFQMEILFMQIFRY